MKRAHAVIAVHAIKALRGTVLYLHTLTLALNTDEWPASCPGLFNSKERVPDTQRRRLGGAMSWYECLREEKKLLPLLGIQLQLLCRLVTILTELYIPTHT